MQDLINTLIKTAKLAGQAALEYYNSTDLEITQKDNKSEDSPLTKADLTSEKVILENLEIFDYGILSEETDKENDRLNKDYVWIIDPLDGTKDFIQKTDEFTVMIGLAHKGQVEMGVVYQPANDTIYFAEKGKGAFKQVGETQPEQIYVSTRNNFSEMKMIASRNHLSDSVTNLANKLGIKDFVKCGSAGLKICKIAEGLADIYPSFTDKTFEWDVCAADIILSEAGGKLTSTKGKVFIYNKEKTNNEFGYLASNNQIHTTLVEEVKDVMYG
jgi:3'(2'), 5'-bisphosphate nucleotidase